MAGTEITVQAQGNAHEKDGERGIEGTSYLSCSMITLPSSLRQTLRPTVGHVTQSNKWFENPYVEQDKV